MIKNNKQLHEVDGESNRVSGKCYHPLQSVIRVAGVIDRTRSPLELVLIDWALENWAEPIDAITERWGDWEYERKCLGAIFRRAAAADPQWFFSVVASRPREVLALSRYIKSIPWPDLGGFAEWGEVPGRMGWAEYVRAIGAVEGM